MSIYMSQVENVHYHDSACFPLASAQNNPILLPQASPCAHPPFLRRLHALRSQLIPDILTPILPPLPPPPLLLFARLPPALQDPPDRLGGYLKLLRKHRRRVELRVLRMELADAVHGIGRKTLPGRPAGAIELGGQRRLLGLPLLCFRRGRHSCGLVGYFLSLTGGFRRPLAGGPGLFYASPARLLL